MEEFHSVTNSVGDSGLAHGWAIMESGYSDARVDVPTRGRMHEAPIACLYIDKSLSFNVGLSVR